MKKFSKICPVKTGLCLLLQLWVISLSSSLGAQSMAKPEIIDHPAKHETEIKFDGVLFTKYIYSPDLEKPILFPIYTSSGQMVTRGYPRIPIEGERSDHPHHLGLWFNYGDVNGLDFWNNSMAISADRKDKYGEVRHQKILKIESRGDIGTLEAEANWNNSKQETLLVEKTKFEFSKSGHTIIIDRSATLTAQQDILFKDNKEGMIAIRVTRALELPADRPETFTDALGNPTEVKVLNNDGVSGDYLSSDGLTGQDVWGSRAKWVRLSGQVDRRDVSLVIIDHPENPGYPTYWHARGYGLFAANTLGQNAFDKKQTLNYHLRKGDSVTFKYRILVHDGSPLTPDDIAGFQSGFIQ